MTIALGFLNPWALWLLPLAAIPIVIHLLNRRRFKKVRWAAMTFLLAAMKRNRRRMRMEQWLILALRTLAVLLLVLLVSRPRFDDAVFGGAREHHVVCLDDSASMAHRGAAEAAFDEGLAAVQRLVERLAVGDGGDQLTVFRASDPQQPIVPVTTIGPGIAMRVREELAKLRVGDGRLDAEGALAAAARIFAAGEGAEHAEFHVVTDFRKIDFLDANGGPRAGVRDWLRDRDPERESVLLHAVGSADCENLAISSVTCRERVCTVGLPITFAVEIVNRGLETSPAVDLTIEFDERSRTSYPVRPLGAGEQTVIEAAHTFHVAGHHGLTATLPEDRFAVDDSRALAFEVRERSRVLLVDGDPGDEPEDAETYYLHAALEIRGEIDSGIEVRLIGDHELGDVTDEELAALDMVWLCDVPRPPATAVERLERFAREGGGVVVFLGDQIDLGHYDRVVWSGGDGILTNRPSTVAGDMDAPRHVHLAAEDDELFAVNTEETEFMFEQLVSIGRFIEVEEQPGSDRRVLLRIGDEDGPPLLVSRDLGDGRVFNVMTGADARWSTWPLWPVYVMTVISMHRNAARPQDLSALNFTPDGTAKLEIDSGRYRTDVAVEPRTRVGEQRTFSSPPEPSGTTEIEIPMRGLEGYGLFEIALARHDGRIERRLLSRNPPAAEGELQRMSADGFARTYPEDVAERLTIVEGQGSARGDVAAAGSSGTWRWIGLALLCGMLLETILAWRFGRR